MTTDEIIALMRAGKEHGVRELSIDKIVIKFDNKRETSETEEIPYSAPDNTDQSEIETEETVVTDDYKLEKAEELALMAIENPSGFENLLATQPELLSEFENSLVEE